MADKNPLATKPRQISEDLDQQIRMRDLLPLFGGNASLVYREALALLHAQRFPPASALPTILGWSEVRTARAVMDCAWCDQPIAPGEVYRAADTDNNAAVFAHDRCTE